MFSVELGIIWMNNTEGECFASCAEALLDISLPWYVYIEAMKPHGIQQISVYKRRQSRAFLLVIEVLGSGFQMADVVPAKQELAASEAGAVKRASDLLELHSVHYTINTIAHIETYSRLLSVTHYTLLDSLSLHLPPISPTNLEYRTSLQPSNVPAVLVGLFRVKP